MTTVHDVLSAKRSDIYSISPDATVLEAVQEMSDKNVGALIVLNDKGQLTGIISERDYARKIVLSGRTSPNTPVHEIMSKRVVCTRPEQRIDECMAIMTARAIRHLPVLDHKKVVGIVSIGDLVKATIDDQKFLIDQLEHYVQGTY